MGGAILSVLTWAGAAALLLLQARIINRLADFINRCCSDIFEAMKPSSNLRKIKD